MTRTQAQMIVKNMLQKRAEKHDVLDSAADFVKRITQGNPYLIWPLFRTLF